MLRLRPRGDPTGPLRELDHDRSNQEGKTRPEAGGIRGKVPLGAGPEAVAGIGERRNTAPFCLVTRRLAGAVGIDPNEDHLGLAATDPFGHLGRMRRTRLNFYGKKHPKGSKRFFPRACEGWPRSWAESHRTLAIGRLDFRKKKARAGVSGSRLGSLCSFCSFPLRRSRLLMAAFFAPESR
ncbi:hypothetical protein MPNT_50075 [Candidatus Methylacidithermus pantelleriae]|uniref:Uncharacterized protein n=1 Tax=Candidatus Methylacidithermus pantelleriae TaxID=2744239 RepID=A0A8J2BRS4_9BACT|nr:hypothetical protein MPNT_50075 [Candidatus Methylacidithermus pantelleriae]